jgi:hypothetical protein
MEGIKRMEAPSAEDAVSGVDAIIIILIG